MAAFGELQPYRQSEPERLERSDPARQGRVGPKRTPALPATTPVSADTLQSDLTPCKVDDAKGGCAPR